VSLTLLAVNDFHGALYESPDRKDDQMAYGGLPWLVGAVERVRAEVGPVLLFDGGDLFQGSWPVNATHGRGSVLAYNLMGVDAAAVGNHEFDYGGAEGGHPLRGAFENAAREAEYAWLSANVFDQNGVRWQPEGVAPWTVIERGGVRVGVIGLTTTDTPSTTLAKNVVDLQFRDVVQVVGELAPRLRDDERADVVVVVGHLTGACRPDGFASPGEPCSPPDTEIGRLLTELPEGTVDVIVAGHAHTVLAQRSGDTFVLENRSGGRMIGRVDLVVGPEGVDHDASRLHEPWPLHHPRVDPGCGGGDYDLTPRPLGGRLVTPSAEALALIRELESETGSLCEPVGCAAEVITRSRHEEAPAANLMADAMLAAFPGADLALPNSGGVRADLPSGELRREHIQQIMPFNNRLVLVELTGERLSLLMRLGSSGAHGILQIAGGTYGFNPEASGGSDLDGDGEVAPWEADRLCGVSVAGAPVDPTATYKVVVSDFLLGGGDDLGWALAGAPVLKEGGLLRDAIEAYVSGLDRCVGAGTEAVNPESPRIELGACR